MMALFDLLILAMAAAIVYLIVQSRRQATSVEAPPAVDPEAQRLTDEVRELRARIHVLERVITDNHGSTDLDAEIERLRDR